AGLAAAAFAAFFTRPATEGVALPPGPDAQAKDRAYKAFQDRLDGYRSCRADAECVRVKADCACTAVAKDRLADFQADFARTAAAAGLSTCQDWPEPSCADATSSPVCAHGACRVHVTIEDATWDQ
ncbi:MAG: hypothetical protein FD126_1392, partial [Elusimicrobia bacterium]